MKKAIMLYLVIIIMVSILFLISAMFENISIEKDTEKNYLELIKNAK